MNRKTLSVTGMSCNGCERNVETALKNVGGVTRVDADHTGDTVEVVVNEDVKDEDLHGAIEQAGYEVSP
ncbi:heavy-metal-associated domain-containing protein [Haloarcula sp. JP-L23]|uniref:heavy-metal-associated domain-containing protein n=1 Tax=Haloarcula sp. JP-L23 TaxID=2716717 RepID=UPI00140EDD4C|nr:heavy-metal-associated domain-containing protein [Haloarcula sp. JP-L23]